MAFKPEGHEKYSVSNYMKFEEGINKFRILKEPITGYVYWEDKDGNIVPRGKMGGEGARPIRMRADAGPFEQEQISAMKMFAAMIVWNYQAEKIQISDITQVSILNALDALLDSPSWGDVTGYDIVVTRKGEKLDTEYSVMPEPKTDVSKKILEAYETTPVKVEALYDGDDPFEVNEDVSPEEVLV